MVNTSLYVVSELNARIYQTVKSQFYGILLVISEYPMEILFYNSPYGTVGIRNHQAITEKGTQI